VTPGSVKAFAVGDKTLAVYNIDGTFYVTDDECTTRRRASPTA
jgi:nitrite reductase/ring-hydroxylating ferredoxin subunit